MHMMLFVSFQLNGDGDWEYDDITLERVGNHSNRVKLKFCGRRSEGDLVFSEKLMFSCSSSRLSVKGQLLACHSRIL